MLLLLPIDQVLVRRCIMMAMLPCTAHPNRFKSQCTLFQLFHWHTVFHAVSMLRFFLLKLCIKATDQV